MLGHEYYHGSLKRYVAAFGTLFNDITIRRRDSGGTSIQRIKVPIQYGPIQKFLAKLQQDPDQNNPAAIYLPRMSFELVGFQYDGERKVTNNFRRRIESASNTELVDTQLTPIPYNMDFELNIITKYTEDGNKILEQILPFFRPEWTTTMELIDGLDIAVDVPLNLVGVATEDTYEGDFETRRALLWTLTFTMKGYFFGPAVNKKVIKFANTNVYESLTANSASENVYVQPGLDANGAPTTILANSVDIANIGADDDYGFVVVITDVDGN